MQALDSAIYSTVHDSEIKTKDLAVMLGMSHQILINKANCQCETNKFTAHELVALQKHTGSTRIAEAMCLELGLNVVSTVSEEPESLMNAMLAVVSECGDVSRVLKVAMHDGRLTNREKDAIQKEISEAIASLVAMRSTIEKE